MSKTALLSILLLSALSCGEMAYSPFQTDLPEEAKGLTAKNLLKISALPPAEEFKIALVADTHSYYEDLNDAVESINGRGDIAFVVSLGDATDAGLKDEYLRFYAVIKKLAAPFLTVVASHEALSNGKDIYRDMFGPFNYSFAYGGAFFIIFNLNKLDFPSGVPDFPWLESELQRGAGYKNIIVFAHVPPVISEISESTGLNSDDVAVWKSLMAKYGVKLSVSAHLHYGESFFENGVRYIFVPWVRDVRYTILTIGKTGIAYEQCNGLSCEQVP